MKTNSVNRPALTRSYATLTLSQCAGVDWQNWATLHQCPQLAVEKKPKGITDKQLKHSGPLFSLHISFIPLKTISYFSHKVHEVHARLVGLGVSQVEERGHPEADGIGTAATLQQFVHCVHNLPNHLSKNNKNRTIMTKMPTAFM